MNSTQEQRVRTGLEVLLDDKLDLIAGQRVGLVSHPAAVLPDFTHCLDALMTRRVEITALFGPEHVFRASAADGAAVGNEKDQRTGLPIFSLYGETREPDKTMLDLVDVLLFDMQDVGVRFYTYLSTLFYILKATGKSGIPLIVLDRPNPINGMDLEGWSLDPGLESFVGIVSIPIRHGMTLGELALWMNQTCELNARLRVIAMQGWKRWMWFDQTSLPWVSTSPGIPQFITTLVYPGTCLIEGTNLSEGRGTSQPFEICGAPWLDAHALADRLNSQQLPGVRFRPLQFIPSTSKHAGQACMGVQLHITDRYQFKPVQAGVSLLAACREEDPHSFEILPSSWEGRPPHLDLLAGTTRLREGLLGGSSPDEMLATSVSFLAQFAESRRSCLLYGEEGG
jgi:uncharacterized protein YbbC (DUF1343 family)